ncbi:hypothetical protein [Halosimplex salinum]|uniref:hypothetical protein n=1 Tax=Halosimplex salinum TaxID=1710538 RepID=UPI000F4A4C4E|nr:hypothetical protein [Halosimplex salinum]
MGTLPSVATDPGLLVGLLCGAAGFALRGTEAAVLWFVVGYFVGKSIQSTVWTLTGGPTAR